MYKEELKKNVEKVASMYDGYLLNYSNKDGSLVSVVQGKEAQEIRKNIMENKDKDIL